MKFSLFLILIMLIVGCQNRSIKSKVSKQEMTNTLLQVEQQLQESQIPPDEEIEDDTSATDTSDVVQIIEQAALEDEQEQNKEIKIEDIGEFYQERVLKTEIKKQDSIQLSDSMFDFDGHILSKDNIYLVFTDRERFHFIFNKKVFGIKEITIENKTKQSARTKELVLGYMGLDEFFDMYDGRKYTIYNFGPRSAKYYKALYLFWLNICQGRDYISTSGLRTQMVHTLEKIVDFEVQVFSISSGGQRIYFSNLDIQTNFDDIFSAYYTNIYRGTL